MATNNFVDEKNVGIQSLTSAGAINGRTITGTANQIAVSNGDGQAGNPTISLTSTIQVSGISFDSGTTTLANYATGTFTPVLIGTTTNPTVGYTVQLGRYTRIGNRVFFNLNITLSSFTGGSGNDNISGLPFTSQATNKNEHHWAMQLENTTFGVNVLYYNSTLKNNATVMEFDGMKNNGNLGAIPIANTTATTKIITSFVYEV